MLLRYPAFQVALSKEFPSDAMKTSALPPLLEARLLSSRTLSSAVHVAVASLRSTIQPTTQNNDLQAKAPEKDVSAEATNGEEKVVGEDTNDEEQSDNEDTNDEGDRLESDDGWESGTIDEEHSEYGNDNETSVDAVPKSVTRTRPAGASKGVASKSSNAGTESLFLPSLSVGFTRGDSDTDWSDSEVRHADGQRKNRRGQRARRAYVFRLDIEQ